MSITTTAPPLEIAPSRLLLMPLISAAGCVALADWLFYGWKIGISLPLFFLALGLIAVARNRIYASRRVQIAMSVVFAAVLIALIEDVNILSVMLGALGTGFFVMVITAAPPSTAHLQVWTSFSVPGRRSVRWSCSTGYLRCKADSI